MSSSFTLPDAASLGDLRTYLGRAARIEDGSVRLIADSGGPGGLHRDPLPARSARRAADRPRPPDLRADAAGEHRRRRAAAVVPGTSAAARRGSGRRPRGQRRPDACHPDRGRVAPRGPHRDVGSDLAAPWWMGPAAGRLRGAPAPRGAAGD
ncbi:hypothetical protein [Curtobacterium sp. MCPF17_052]|uniref:hypothetical protein n=1 Tax=Curtobacterium sp. MCPF17_052 TaxID=2175655 RepID=UPI0024DF781E|nr:hypothetical protein [Curtobacterium sp. MCPF17_052]WIB12120.1 hypothetical protein DEJ36_15290 [Curtobacterium sp. MCPF17_052]